MVCRKGSDWVSHTALATDSWEEAMQFLWGKDTAQYRLFIRGREYNIHPSIFMMEKEQAFYMAIDSLYDEHGDFPYESVDNESEF